MRVGLKDKQLKISFHHISRFKEPPPNTFPKRVGNEIFLPAKLFGLGGKKFFRGMTRCFISEVVDLGDEENGQQSVRVEVLAEGVALCSEFDQYNKETGRQYSLYHALGMVLEAETTSFLDLDDDDDEEEETKMRWTTTTSSPFTDAETGAILYAYFMRPRVRPTMTQLVEKRANEIIEGLKEAAKAIHPELDPETIQVVTDIEEEVTVEKEEDKAAAATISENQPTNH